MKSHNFLEVGAAALLVGDLESKLKDQPWKHFGTAEMPFLEQLLQPSPVTAVADCTLARPHLRAITASKRTKASPQRIWYVIFLTQISFFTCLVYLALVIHILF